MKQLLFALLFGLSACSETTTSTKETLEQRCNEDKSRCYFERVKHNKTCETITETKCTDEIIRPRAN